MEEMKSLFGNIRVVNNVKLYYQCNVNWLHSLINILFSMTVLLCRLWNTRT